MLSGKMANVPNVLMELTSMSMVFVHLSILYVWLGARLTENVNLGYLSFDLINGQCIPSKKDNIDQNCNKFNAKGVCTQCSMGFYFSAANVCTQVDPLCSSFDSKFARCYTCYPGYKVSSAANVLKTVKYWVI